MELKDTTELMNNADYKKRFVAEYLQIKIRYEKLKKFCDKIEVSYITEADEPKHDCPYELLREQQCVMEEYLHLLELRAIIENINLDLIYWEDYVKMNNEGED